MNLFLHYLSVIKRTFLATKSIRIPIYILSTCLYGFLGRFSSFFQRKYIKNASQFKDYIVNTKHGEYVCSNFHDFLMMDDNYEPEAHNIIKKIKNTKDDYLINIGCNVGRWAIACAKIYGYNVIAFEPAPDTYRRLKINVLLSNLSDKIEILNIGLGDENQKMKFDYIPQRNGGSKVIQDDTNIEGNIIEVPIKRFDDLGIEKEKIEKTRLIIMDVEGFELNVLKGMENTLKKFSNINLIVEISNNKENKNETIKFMNSLGYSEKQIDDSNWLFSK